MRTMLDATDLRILEHLQEDGRRPFAVIARQLGLAEATVRQRVNRLVRRGLIQIVAVADPLHLGFILAEIGVRIRGPITATAEWLAKIPEVDYIAICTGSFDLLIEVVCVDNDHFLRLLSEGIRRAPGVDHAETFTILKVAKDSYRYTGLEFASSATESDNNVASD